MKKQIFNLFLFALFSFRAYSQCTPDNVNCQDVLTPGQICPDVLADAYLGLSYNQTVTIIPPPSATLNNITITIVKIKIDTITNLPPGIVYETNATEMYPGTAYCASVSGTPTHTGEYMLHISVIPYINLLGDIVAIPPVANDTSVKITVLQPDAVNNPTDEDFHAIENRPNPFSETTEIGFVMNESSEVKLLVHNNLGVLVYRETIQANPGRNFFRFTGENIVPGHYICTLINKQEVHTLKIIKTTGR
jgi:hypothetical protein